MLDQGAAWLAKQREKHMSLLIEYERPDVGETEINAKRGRTEAEVIRGDGYSEGVRTVDWLISVGDLVIENEPVEPRDGDLIHERGAAGTVTYQVTPLGAEPWRYADGYRKTIRIHTRRVKVTPY